MRAQHLTLRGGIGVRSFHLRAPIHLPNGGPVTENRLHNDRILTRHLYVVILAALYALIRVAGGDPEDATAYVLFAGALLNVRL